MKKYLVILFLFIYVQSYSQGFRALTRQGESAFKDGDYATATINSIKALQEKNNFDKSIELFEKSILRVNKFYETKIKILEGNSIPFDDLSDVESAREIADLYYKLVEVQNELMFFPENVKLSNKKLVLDNTKDYNNQLSEARSRVEQYNLLAAEMVYNSASELYSSAESKYDFQRAYFEFEEVSKYVSGYKNSYTLKNESLQKGILRIGVLPPANSSGRQDTRFNVINTSVNQIRSIINENLFIETVNVTDRSIGSYSNNYSGINADLVIKITFNDWSYGQSKVKDEAYSNEDSKTKKDGTVEVSKVSGRLIVNEYYANYDVIVEAISTSDNTIEKSQNLTFNFTDQVGFLVGSGDRKANKSGFPLVSEIGRPSLREFAISGNYGIRNSGSESSEELFKDAFRNHVTSLISSWFNQRL
jgi:tetratricopeptide (TPR) repeat protein